MPTPPILLTHRTHKALWYIHRICTQNHHKHSSPVFVTNFQEKSSLSFIKKSTISPSSSSSSGLSFMDTAQWPQEIVVKPIEEIETNSCTKLVAAAGGGNLERKSRPQKEQALNCPRCNSINTKFCYYNNYSLTQPRYFCKTCRRYWTEGGSLRNIPVGGGSRKNKRSSSTTTTATTSTSSSSTTTNSSSSKKLADLVTQNPKITTQEGQDLNLAYPSSHHQGIRSFSELIQLPPSSNNLENKNHISSSSSSAASNPTNAAAVTTTSHQLSALELITGISSRGLNSFPIPPVQDPNTLYTSGFPLLHDFKPSSLNFSLDGITGNGFNNGGLHGVQDSSTNGRLLFPFEDLKTTTTTTHDIHHDQQNRDHHQHGDSTGYWTGMLGGGSW